MTDFLGFFFSLLATYYSVKIDIRTWPYSFIAIAINTYAYWNAQLHGLAILEMLFIVSVFYGWFYWKRPVKYKAVQNIKTETLVILCLLAPFVIYLMNALIYSKTDSKYAFLEATIMVLSLIAQWLLCRKIIQCWYLWFVVDILVGFLNWQNALPFHSLLYTLYLGLAILGLIQWSREMDINKQAQSMPCPD